MKIIKQTSDELITKDGGKSIFIPIIFLIFGLSAVYFYFQGNQQNSVITVIFGLVFAGIAIFLILKRSTITIDINKTTGKISFDKKAIAGSLSAEYDIANVQSVELREGSYISNNTTNNGPQGFSMNNSYATRVLTHQSVLVLKDGTELPLEGVQSNNNFSVNNVPVGQILMAGRGKMFAVSNEIAQFIGVPFKTIGETGISNVIPNIPN